MSAPYDVVIIGGGIVGAATAMTLASQNRRVALLEATDKLAAHQSGHNSGVIHAGLYYRPGSLKARLCAEGRTELYRFCETEGIPHRRCGKLVVASRDRDRPALDELERRGAANGLAGLKRLTAAELREYEPEVIGVAGLWVPQTGVVDYALVTAVAATASDRMGQRACHGHLGRQCVRAFRNDRRRVHVAIHRELRWITGGSRGATRG